MIGALRRLFSKKTDDGAPPRVGAGRRVYAIGDIHGRADLLAELHGLVLDDAASHPDREKALVYMGDYVDRGADSRAVIEMLTAAPLSGFETIHLLGNHEDLLSRFLEDCSISGLWLANGGVETLQSYGVANAAADASAEEITDFQREFADRLPAGHRGFLRSLVLYHIEGDYLFAHAGVRPGTAIECQNPDDLIWIRDEFLNSKRDHGHIVVHGHSISGEVEFRDNRIGIDTGAFNTGRLTCLVLDGAGRAILDTG